MEKMIPPPGELVCDTLKGPLLSIKGGSDGSLYPDDHVMTSAWIIAEDETNFTSACTVIWNVSSLSPYRAELEGTFRLLRHIDWLRLTPEEVRHWCDNKGAIKANKRQVGLRSGGQALPVPSPAQGPPDTAENVS